MDYSDFLWFAEERESVRLKKEADCQRPWSSDHILANTRFCNIDRIHDRGTVRLLNFVEGMNTWEKIFYITLYRSALSSEEFLKEMTGVWFHDFRNLRELPLKISDSRKPYQVFLRSGDTVRSFLVVFVTKVVRFIYSSMNKWDGASIYQASEEIADEFKSLYNKKMMFLSTEICKDLSYFFPTKILPHSECRMNIGARMALKKLPGRRIDEKVEKLLSISNLSHSSLEHGLCEWNRYITRKRYFKEHGKLKPEWLYP